MPNRTLSIFVDESGRFQHPDTVSRFYILTLVLHDQSFDISPLADRLDRDLCSLGVVGQYFHAGPLIRQEKGFALMTWELRGKIFARMMAFARKADFRYRCLSVDKRFVSSMRQIGEELESQLKSFAAEHVEGFKAFDEVKVYYDSGQADITNMLHRVFDNMTGVAVSFAQKVRPERYKLFQIADMICTLRLVALKIETGTGMSRSERIFFGGPRQFQRDYLKKIKSKEI